MAVNHIYFNPGTQHGAMLRAHLQQLKNGRDGLNDVLATMTLMVDGNGSDAAHFTYMTAKFGFTDNAAAKAAWDELNSLMFKLNTDAEVTMVKTATDQACNKLR